MADNPIPVTVSLTGEHTFVLRFPRDEYQRHLADARAAGLSLETHLARRLAAAVLVEGLIVMGLAQKVRAGTDPEEYDEHDRVMVS